jgi:tetratricopeptide (TPR) repeat protein
MAEAHALRGQIYTSRDEVSQAISEYGEAIGIDPKNSGAYFARGRLYFETQNFGAAAEDFVKAAAKGDRSFVILWLFLARGHLGQDGNRELAIWSETTPKNAWPFPLAEFYLGSRPLAQVEEAATTNDQKCELAFYLGELHIVAKNEKEALQPLTRAKNLCPDDYVETRLARKDSQRLQAALDGATAGDASLQRSKSNAAGGRAPAGVSPSANVPPGSTPSPPTTKAVWRTMLTNSSRGIDRALRIDGISIDDGSVAIVSLARPRNRSLQTEYVMTLATRNLSKKTGSNYLSARIAVVGDHSSETVAISLPLGTAGVFQGGLSRAAIEQFIGAAYHGRVLKLTFFGVDAMNARIPLGKTAVEIDDAARAALELGAHGLTDTAITPSEKKSSDLAAKEPQLSKSVTRDDNVRRYLSMIEAEAAQSHISVALLSAKRSPDGADLIVTAQVKNRWNQAVMLGELSVEAFRLLNPNLSKVVPTYPESLISARALNVAAEPIAAGETKTLTIRIGDLKSLRSFLESQGPSRQRHAALTFYGPSGQRNVARIAGITKLFE